MDKSKTWLAILLGVSILGALVFIQREIATIGDTLGGIRDDVRDAAGPLIPTPADDIVVIPDEGNGNRAVWSWADSSATFGESRTIRADGIGAYYFVGGIPEGDSTFARSTMWEVKIADAPDPTVVHTIQAWRFGNQFAYYIDGERVRTCMMDCTGQLPAEFDGYIIGDMKMYPGDVTATALRTQRSEE